MSTTSLPRESNTYFFRPFQSVLSYHLQKGIMYAFSSGFFLFGVGLDCFRVVFRVEFKEPLYSYVYDDQVKIKLPYTIYN